MPLGFFSKRLELLSSEEVYMIRENALEILEKVGFVFNHRGVLKLFEGYGSVVDYKRNLVKIPEELVLERVSKAPKLSSVSSPDGTCEAKIGDEKLKASMCCEIYLVDYLKMERRLATTEDCVKSIVIGNSLKNISFVTPFVMPSDIPLKIRDIHSFKLLFMYSKKPCGSWIYSPDSLKYIIEMGKAVAGGEEELRKMKLIRYGAEPTSPLQLSRHAIEILIELSKYEQPISAVGSMTLMGGTGPVTIAGSLSLQTAEVLAGITLVNLLNPKTPVYFFTSIHVLDQRTGLCCFGAPENILACLAGIQVARSFTLPCFCNVGLTDSNYPDFQAGFEKGLSTALVIAAGAEGIGAQGIVGADQGASWEQLVIDNEWLDYFNRVLRGFEVNSETLALNIIEKVGPGGNFLKEMHTVKHFRKELWFPKIFNRENWTTWVKNKKSLLNKAHFIVENILKENYPPEPVIDRNIIKDLDKIEEKAKHEIYKT